MPATEEQRQAAKRATDRARGILKPGDQLYFTRCGGLRSRAIMTGWDGDWICSKNLSDIHAHHILRVNGKPVSFRDPATP